MACVDRVAKNGSNVSQGYKYAQAADVYDAVRAELAKRFIIPIPNVLKSEFFDAPTKSGGTMRYCTLTVRYDFIDGDSGETISSTIVGQGSDSGDKGVYKAQTGATKNCLVNLFLIPTGDDPEHEERRNDPPPPAGLDSIRRHIPPTPPSQPKAGSPQRTHQNIVMGNFGRSKGLSLFDISDDDVSFYRNACKKTLADPSKERFHASEAQRLTIFDAELRARGLPVEQ